MQEQTRKWMESVQEQTKTTGQPETLNGQQLTALQKQWAAQVGMVLHDMELRKYVLGLAADKHAGQEIIVVATAMYDFLTLPAAEVKVTIS